MKITELYNKVPKTVREAVKEMLRMVLIALVSYLASGQELDRAVVIGILLRSADKVLHEYGKEYNKPKLVSGLTRF